MSESIGDLLRDWRTRRRISQLELALAAGVSARHISFIETGRTRPSRRSVLRLADQLEVPLRQRNRLLVAAGYAPLYVGRPLEDPDLATARAAVGRILRAHEPSPAVALDRHWNVLLTNGAAQVFFDDVSPALLEPPVNMMRLGMHPDGFSGRVRNLDEVRAHWLPRLARQSARTGDPELHALYDELIRYGSPPAMTVPDAAAVGLSIRIEYAGEELHFLSTVTTFGAVFDLTLDEIVMETYFPADDRTAVLLRSLPG